MSYGTFITLNWNPSDALLTKTFNNISDPSFNLTKTDKNLYQNLEWALMQGKRRETLKKVGTARGTITSTAQASASALWHSQTQRHAEF